MQGSIVGDLNFLSGTPRNKAGDSLCRTTEYAIAQSSRYEQRSPAEQPSPQNRLRAAKEVYETGLRKLRKCGSRVVAWELFPTPAEHPIVDPILRMRRPYVGRCEHSSSMERKSLVRGSRRQLKIAKPGGCPFRITAHTATERQAAPQRFAPATLLPASQPNTSAGPKVMPGPG